jgi:hypothetical protein
MAKSDRKGRENRCEKSVVTLAVRGWCRFSLAAIGAQTAERFWTAKMSQACHCKRRACELRRRSSDLDSRIKEKALS